MNDRIINAPISKIVEAIKNAIETADSDTYINSTRDDRITEALASLGGGGEE